MYQFLHKKIKSNKDQYNHTTSEVTIAQVSVNFTKTSSKIGAVSIYSHYNGFFLPWGSIIVQLG